MGVPQEHTSGEIRRLKRCLNDMVSVLALPAMWSGSQPSQIVHTLLDALLGMLCLDFVYARFEDPAGGAPIELLKIAPSTTWMLPDDIHKTVNQWFGDDPQKWPSRLRAPISDEDISIVSQRCGLHGEIGVIVAGSGRADFPGQTETLLLSVAANQAVIGLHEARLLMEQTRVLAASEHNLRLVFDRIPGLVALLTSAGDVELVNPQLVEYCGRSLDELRLWGTSDTVHAEDLPRVAQIFARSIKSGNPYDFEARLRRFDGIYRWFQVRGLPVRDENGPILRWCALHTDIDDRKRAEDALRVSECDLSSIINTIPMLAWSARPDGFCDFLNQRWLDFTGLSAEQARGSGWGAAIHPVCSVPARCAMNRARSSNGTGPTPISTTASERRRNCSAVRHFSRKASV